MPALFPTASINPLGENCKHSIASLPVSWYSARVFLDWKSITFHDPVSNPMSKIVPLLEKQQQTGVSCKYMQKKWIVKLNKKALLSTYT